MNKRPTYRSDQKDFEKYFEDQLPEAERHTMEKAALEDAFEAEAMEGWEEVDMETARVDLASLRKNIHGSRKAPFAWWQLAAAVALLVVSGVLVWQFSEGTEPEPLAQSAPEQELKSAEPGVEAMEEAVQAELIVEADEANADLQDEGEAEATPAQPAPEVALPAVVSNTPEEEPQEAWPTRQQAVARTPVPGLPAKKMENDDLVASVPSLEGQILSQEEKEPDVIALVVPESEGSPVRYNTDQSQLSFSDEDLIEVKAMDKFRSRHIAGNISSEDGRSLKGARIELQEAPIGTIADEDGFFEMAIPDSIDSPTLTFSDRGFQQKQFQLDDHDTFNVTLAPFQQALRSGQVTQDSMEGLENFWESNESITTAAEPIGGHKRYEKYLRKQARRPSAAKQNRIRGRVLMELTIDAYGNIDQVKVLQGLGYGCDEEAIRVVKEGPNWLPARTAGEFTESTVEVAVPFR